MVPYLRRPDQCLPGSTSLGDTSSEVSLVQWMAHTSGSIRCLLVGISEVSAAISEVTRCLQQK